jgi:hypothetical protein
MCCCLLLQPQVAINYLFYPVISSTAGLPSNLTPGANSLLLQPQVAINYLFYPVIVALLAYLVIPHPEQTATIQSSSH